MPSSRKLLIIAQAGRQFVPYLRRHLRAALPMINTHLDELSVILIGDRHMAELHRYAMGQTGPTDVLTFPIEVDSRRRAISGEIYICVPEARRRARELGMTVRDELLLYALHGMLHLSGLDDRTQREFDRMHRIEDRILTRLGMGPVFRPAARQSPRPARATTSRRRSGEVRR